MKLNLSEIKEITLGAVRILENENGIDFYRFTEEQEKFYEKRSEDFYKKTFSTSGIRLRFRTDSRNLFLKAEITSGTSRSYFSVDVVVNGEIVGSLNNFSGVDLPPHYTVTKLPFGEFHKSFDLGAAEKDVEIFLPWSVRLTLKELSLDDGSYIEPIKRSRKILCFGDSITHGYDALYPSNKYISKLSDMLDAEEYNKAIGGEIFAPELASLREDFDPDYITVAYGTNDWNVSTKEEFTYNSGEFFRNLNKSYPNSRILALTPIWREESDKIRRVGEFKCVGEIIQKQAEEFDNIYVISGFELVPADKKLYADLRLHPNDAGFGYYFENLAKSIKDIL